MLPCQKRKEKLLHMFNFPLYINQVPDAVLDKRSAAWNKGRAWINGAKKEVVEAYAKQSEEDLENFLRCRKEEIVHGGMLFMLMGGRPGFQHPENQLGDPDSSAKHPFATSMDQAWQDLLKMVSCSLISPCLGIITYIFTFINLHFPIIQFP